MKRALFSGLLITVILSGACCFSNNGFAVAAVSQDAVGCAEININKVDPGTMWMVNSWLGAPKSNSIKSIYRRYSMSRAVVGIYPSAGSYLPFVVAAQTGKNLDNAADKGNILAFMRHEVVNGQFNRSNYRGYELYSGNRPQKKGSFGYFVKGNEVALGNDANAIRKVADASAGAVVPITSLPDYRDLRNRIPAGSDLVFFFANQQNQFANSLKRQEHRWKMSLLLSSAELSGVMGGFNFVDGDKITGSIIFKARNANAIRDVQDDANFLGEAIRRKFSHANITYKKQVITQGNYVTLSFEMRGLKPLFKEMFTNGVSSLLK